MGVWRINAENGEGWVQKPGTFFLLIKRLNRAGVWGGVASRCLVLSSWGHRERMMATEGSSDGLQDTRFKRGQGAEG